MKSLVFFVSISFVVLLTSRTMQAQWERTCGPNSGWTCVDENEADMELGAQSQTFAVAARTPFTCAFRGTESHAIGIPDLRYTSGTETVVLIH